MKKIENIRAETIVTAYTKSNKNFSRCDIIIFIDGILISGYFNHFLKLYVTNFKIFKNTEPNNEFILKKFNQNSIHNSTYFELKKRWIYRDLH